MASLLSLLPQPKNLSSATTKQPKQQQQESTATNLKKQKWAEIPPYGKRGAGYKWVPKTQADFGDGGAYPEIHDLQYPLNMGNAANNSSNTQLALTLDNEGHIQYDKIIKQSQSKDKIIYSKFTDLIERVDEAPIEKPNEEEAKGIADRTRAALERIVNSKISVGYKTNSQKIADSNDAADEAQFYRYTPAKAGIDEPEPKSKIIQMVEAPVDPLEPAKFRSKKMPKEAPSPPVPIMHSPEKKLSAEEAANWKVPPCISNWKNPKGFTIALDKRLAADGRGLQQIQISDGFAKLSEAMYVAEMTAREDIEKRAQFEKMKAIRDNEQHEEKLRRVAQEARMERLKRGGAAGGDDSDDDDGGDDRREAAAAVAAPRGSTSATAEQVAAAPRKMAKHKHVESSDEDDSSADEKDDEETAQRNKVRQQLKYQVERERRMSHKDKSAAKKNKYGDEGEERDITEKVALGQAAKSSVYDAEVDTRLYNMGSTGLDAGFGDEDAYRLYDKPLLSGSSANQIYAPRQANIDQYKTSEEMQAEAADRFESESSIGSKKGGEVSQRVGPVQFEREKQKSAAPSSSASSKQPANEEVDPFGFGQLMDDAKKSKPLDHIGKKGMMSASGGSGQNRDASSMSKRSRIEFGSSENSGTSAKKGRKQ